MLEKSVVDLQEAKQQINDLQEQHKYDEFNQLTLQQKLDETTE